MSRPLRVVTFNVNGIRSIRDYYVQSRLNGNLTFDAFLDSFHADILCFQEHKTNAAARLSHDLSFPRGYAAFYAFPRRPRKTGYSGVVTFVREQSRWLPVACHDGFSGVGDTTMRESPLRESPLRESPLLHRHFSEGELVELDGEARCVITDHLHFLLLNIYFPNDSGPERADYRDRFYRAVLLRCLDLIQTHGRSLILLGDINITPHPLDHCEFAGGFAGGPVGVAEIAAALRSDSQHTPLHAFYENPMRRWLADWLYNRRMLLNGETIEATDDTAWRDCFRALNPFESCRERYTCWNTLIGARGSNYGTRIDTIFTAGPLFAADNNLVADTDHATDNGQTTNSLASLVHCDIRPDVMGSDHCPVVADFTFSNVFLEVNDDALSERQLRKGNIPRSFGRLDQYFVSKKRLNEGDSSTDQTRQTNSTTSEATITERDCVAKKFTILDYFGRKETCLDPTGKDASLSALSALSASTDRAESQSSTDEASCAPCASRASDAPSEKSGQNAALNADWAKLFGQSRPPPRCNGHNEPCILLRVNKPGRNRGRRFFMCARPVGPSTDPQARCDHFEWLNKER